MSSQQLSEKDKVLIPLFALITRRHLRTVVIRFCLDFKATPNEKSHNCCKGKSRNYCWGRVYTVDEKLLRKVKDLPFVLPTLQSRGTALPLMRANDSLTLISHS
ncbi:hypothetical protein MetMK1DRAFT_00005160 [Metallosphaera yellowstonensis MK1]|uniref:Uncharacterized protein n=1 Tax=Metallosphaera yellowstonensis MK1 TaxID=671065 RepID=H2C193_9CREN|nr:hypothetical protein MetMK1DRAFT_00005160 [Metallosphaera yellowstonensis MK1]